jgi:hypothetical protein
VSAGTPLKDLQQATDEAERITGQTGPLVIGKTWQDIANCAEMAGRERDVGGTPLEWRTAAASPETPASQRVLRELLWYFEEEGYAVTNGLTLDQAAGAPRAMEIEDTLEALLDATTPRLAKGKVGRHVLRIGGRKMRTQDFKTPTGSWVERWNGGVWFGYDTDSKPSPGVSDGQLEFQVGVWVRMKQARLLDNKKDFKAQVNARELTFDINEDGGWIWASAAANTFITADVSETMDTQAERIGAWALPKLHALLTLKLVDTEGEAPLRRTSLESSTRSATQSYSRAGFLLLVASGR